MVSLQLDLESLRPLIAEIVDEVVAKMGQAGGRTDAEPMLSEPEAAALFCVDAHVLREARRRGQLQAHRIGRFVRYDRNQLEAWKAATIIR